MKTRAIAMRKLTALLLLATLGAYSQTTLAADGSAPLATHEQPATNEEPAKGEQPATDGENTSESAAVTATAPGDESPSASEGQGETPAASAVPPATVTTSDDDLPPLSAKERIETYKREVSGVEHEYGPLDVRLAKVLTRLGDAYADNGRFVDAVDSYSQAQHVTRVNNGLHNLDQVDILARKAESLAALGRWPEATTAQVYAYQMEERAYGQHMELLPAIERLSNWYQRSGDVLGARAMSQTYLEILTNETSATDIRRAEALTDLATAYRLERFPMHRRTIESNFEFFRTNPSAASSSDVVLTQVNRFGPGEDALKEAVRIYRAQDPVDQMAVAQALLELADWYLIFDKVERSTQAYREAWELVKSTQSPEVLQEIFSSPRLIYARPPLTPARPGSFDVPQYKGFVNLTHDVDEYGHVENVQVRESEPPELMDISAVKAFRSARFRPQFDDQGNAHASVGLSYRYDFVYYVKPAVASTPAAKEPSHSEEKP